MKNTFLWILLLSLPGLAETILAGKIGGKTLDSAGSPYLIINDIIVPKDKILTLKPGCILLFRPYTGLRVEGSLIADGSQEKPIIFTSSNNDKYSDSVAAPAQAFDWNGITITNNSKNTKLWNFILSYSVFGIKAQTERISISNGVCYSNGQFNITIKEKIQNVIDNFPFYYHADDYKKVPIESKSSTRRLLAPTILGLAGLGVAGLATYFFIDGNNLHHDYETTGNAITAASLNAKEQTALIRAWISVGASATLISASIILFIWSPQPEKKTAVIIQPIIEINRTGVLVRCSF
jgi:hypothetical protein